MTKTEGDEDDGADAAFPGHYRERLLVMMQAVITIVTKCDI